MARTLFIYTITSILLGVCSMSAAQQAEVRPQGRFLADSLKVGQPVPYSYTVTYPQDAEVLVPDSAYDYTPLHYLRREYFSTVKEDSLLKDSVVYYLTTFELDAAQTLALPAYEIDGDDSVEHLPVADTVFLKRMLLAMPDTAALKEMTTLEVVEDRTNWPLITVLLVFALVVIGVILAIVAEPLRRRYRIRRLKREHEKFTTRFVQMAGLINGKPTDPEGALTLWKNYLEKLENKPYPKMTTREIARMRPEKDLHDALRTIDRHIYGSRSFNGEETASYKMLQKVVNRSYEDRLNAARK